MKFYTALELSEMFNLSLKPIQKMLKEKQIESFKIGKKYLVNEESLKRFIESKRVI